MQIEKNIAAMLQSKMKETGKTKLEFSKELGIPRSTLQGYLKGDKCLRSDSIEEIAKRLDLSPAQLISGPAYAEEFGLFSMDALQEELRMLHPQAQGLAREAVALLHAAFRLSAEWNRLDVHPTAARTEDSEGLTYRHIPYEAHGEARMLYAYGILVQKYAAFATAPPVILTILEVSVLRVGRDPIRKLSADERLIKPLMTAVSYGCGVDHLLFGAAAALHFVNSEDLQSVRLQQMLQSKGVMHTLCEYSGLTLENPLT